jgi:hypothetical protein
MNIGLCVVSILTLPMTLCVTAHIKPVQTLELRVLRSHAGAWERSNEFSSHVRPNN